MTEPSWKKMLCIFFFFWFFSCRPTSDQPVVFGISVSINGHRGMSVNLKISSSVRWWTATGVTTLQNDSQKCHTEEGCFIKKPRNRASSLWAWVSVKSERQACEGRRWASSRAYPALWFSWRWLVITAAPPSPAAALWQAKHQGPCIGRLSAV